MVSILERIMATKREEVERAKVFASEEHLRRMVDQQSPPRDFLASICNTPDIALIAEVKKASPSKGVIRESFDPVSIARTYEEHGAACISVLTDEPYFQGHIEFLRWVKDAVQIPILRKDFILDPYQIVESRAYGADAVLLIAECLPGDELPRLYHEVLTWGMTPLVEIYELENLHRVVDLGAKLIGINNRNLRTFEVDLEHTIRLREQIPPDRLVVGESGIQTHEDVKRLARAGVNAILVGESLVRQADIGQAVDHLLGKTHGDVSDGITP